MKYNKHTTSSSSGSGIGILGVLQIIFIVLKCLDLITWPWKVVLIPLWIDLGIIALALLIALGCAMYYAFKNK